jgi:putative hydrolase of the HAD superfamily
MSVELIGLDADDTLWHNEPLYHDIRHRLEALLEQYAAPGSLGDRLDAVERRNLEHFGYGVKGFILSMIETAVEITDGRLPGEDVRVIIEWGREMLASPVDLLDGVREAVQQLAAGFRLILVTKGDLLHQESKLARSGLGEYFSGVEIVSEKDARTYRRVVARYAVAPDRFVMVGNSLRSDILPVLEIGGRAVHVPYPLCWAHEQVSAEALSAAHYHQIAHLGELPALLRDSAPR